MSVHRKGPARGWVYRWRAWDGAKRCAVNRSSAEFTSEKKAAAAEARDETRRRETEELRARHRRGPGLPLLVILDKWEDYKLTRGKVGKGYAYEVRRSLTRLFDGQEWIKPEDISAAALDEALDNGDLTDHTLEYLKSVLNHARRRLRQVFDYEILFTEPAGRRGERSTAKPYTDAELAGILFKADGKGESIGAVVRHLAIYGPRPADVVRLRGRALNEVAATLTLEKTKGGLGGPHPITVEDAQRLARLMHGRSRDMALFCDVDGVEWGNGTHRRPAARLGVWYRRHVTDHLPTNRRGIYLLKDTAISRMEDARISRVDRTLFTKHIDAESLALYEGTNMERARLVLPRIPTLPSPKRPPEEPADGERSGERDGEPGETGNA